MSSSSPLRSFLLFVSVLAAQLRPTHAIGVRFTTPAPGAAYPSGQFAINWEDAGGNIGINSLTTYSLALIVGGNLDDDSRSLITLSPANAKVSDLGLVAQIPIDVGQSIQNGYYLSMQSNVSTGGSVINYSNRFTLIGLNGTTDQKYVAAAASTVGDTNVPGAQLNTIINAPSPSNPPTSPNSTTPDNGPPANNGTAPSTNEDNTYAIAGGALAALLAGTLTSIILLIVLSVLGVFWWRRRRRRQQRARDAGSDENAATSMSAREPTPGGLMDKVELADRTSRVPTAAAIRPLAELDSHGSERFEAMTPVAAVEADSAEIRYELEGDWSGWEAAARRSHVQGYDPTR